MVLEHFDLARDSWPGTPVRHEHGRFDNPAVVASGRWWYHEHVESTSRPATATTADAAIGDALRAFVCSLGPAAAEVHLEFAEGVATLTGAVASETQRRAVEDLLAAHDGVDAVVCELRVVAPGVVASGF